MITLALSSICCCAAAYGLYCDHTTRALFETDFMFYNQIDDKMLITGIITNDNVKSCDIDCSCIYHGLKYPICTTNPIHTADAYVGVQDCIKYERYDYNVNVNNKKNYFVDLYRFPRYRIKTINFWKNYNLCKYVSPFIKFNNKPLKIINEHKINYTMSETHYIGNKSYVIEKYVPDNSEITIFASQVDDCYEAEFIGTKKQVLNDIATKYYGVNDITTVLLTIGLFASVCCFTNALIKN